MTTKVDEVRKTAENYYRNGDYYCSEAIVRTIRDVYQVNAPDTVIAMASGFPVGIGGMGCTCGAVAGGVMALGLFFGRTEPGDPQVNKTMALSAELHDAFKSNHKTLCCRKLIKGLEFGGADHIEQCISFTGEVAAEAAKIIEREQNKVSDQ